MDTLFVVIGVGSIVVCIFAWLIQPPSRTVDPWQRIAIPQSSSAGCLSLMLIAVVLLLALGVAR